MPNPPPPPPPYETTVFLTGGTLVKNKKKAPKVPMCSALADSGRPGEVWRCTQSPPRRPPLLCDRCAVQMRRRQSGWTMGWGPLEGEGVPPTPPKASLPPPPPLSDALEGKGPQRRPQQRLGRRLEGVAKAVGGGYRRLRMPFSLALAVRGTWLGIGWAPWRGKGSLPPSKGVPAPPPTHPPTQAHICIPLSRFTPSLWPRTPPPTA